jgi:plastocyanin
VSDPPQKVTVTDINMPFGSMVVFILKWTLASIPAIIVLFLLGLALSTAALSVVRRANAPDLSRVLTPPTRIDDTPVTSETPPPSGIGAPITGRVFIVRMIGDDNGYRFQPAHITIGPGDGVKFVMTSGGPHNIAFDPGALPEAARTQLSANMSNQMGELSSPLFTSSGESYTISFAGVPSGEYEFYCTPHLAMGMKGSVTVR